MDVVNVGGAAKVGRVSLGPVIDMDGSPEDYDKLESFTEQNYKSTDPVIAKNSNTDVVLYPDYNPAKDMPLTETGAIRLSGDVIASAPNHDRSIDIMKDPGGAHLNIGQKKALDELSARVEEVTQQQAESASTVARDDSGKPLIEVVYNTQIGAIVSYYHEYSISGQWLILGVDCRYPAKDRFVPKAGKGVVIPVTITGPDRSSKHFTVSPVNLQFSLFGYDFLVLLLAEEK